MGLVSRLEPAPQLRDTKLDRLQSVALRVKLFREACAFQLQAYAFLLQLGDPRCFLRVVHYSHEPGRRVIITHVTPPTSQNAAACAKVAIASCVTCVSRRVAKRPIKLPTKPAALPAATAVANLLNETWHAYSGAARS